MEKFITEKKTIGELTQNKLIKFVIPTYQRPYVWDKELVIKFLQDIFDSFTNEQKIYFIGNVYVKQTGENTFDIIDGQQRFITLWLTALAFKQIEVQTIFSSFLGDSKNLRLNFTIRKEVEQYLKHLLSEFNNSFEEEEINKNEFLRYIAEAITTIKNFLISNNIQKCELENFGNYFYNNLTFIYNVAPLNTDLNLLFTALGSSGIQLEQTDILKSKLLRRIENKILYSNIWIVCENMNDYFENNVLAVFSNTDKNLIQENSFESFNKELFIFESTTTTFEQNIVYKSISQIVDNHNSFEINENGDKVSKLRCRSIIPFSVLLLHTYRIFRKKRNQEDFKLPFDKKYLLEIFNELSNETEDIIEFFETLWKVRFLFDKYIVKWRFDNEHDQYTDEVEKLRLAGLNRNNNSFFHENQKFSKESMLQSVLYFNGGYNQQYWLTSYLYYLLEKEDQDEIHAALEQIDNSMLPGEKKNISWSLMDLNLLNKKTTCFNIKEELNKDLGTRFNHYWFYKLEYLLWKGWNNRNDRQFINYRITSKNSIEHVFPQNHEFGKELNKIEGTDWLNSFGNLALLSVGQNSSYSNLSIIKKKDNFINKSTYDSLKLAIIYSSKENWDVDDIKVHQEEMLSLLENHYNNV